MPTSDNARQGHVILCTVLGTLALGVMIASAVMGWWVHESGDSAITGQTASVSTSSPQG